ncbi:hypothetical protein JD292_09865 [Leucobacter sp. CSA2]|uniref:3-hydroxyacyl-CoA dehydrogenase n=1 Tax=Leucobacter edaphi TaxID=2796472 RepID=A0A934QEY6_9MICO|nr:Rv3235 family protein [Leucobacter edaphi]MBK0422379.1 hypothetical protein [Leucobacter edaphi]
MPPALRAHLRPVADPPPLAPSPPPLRPVPPLPPDPGDAADAGAHAQEPAEAWEAQDPLPEPPGAGTLRTLALIAFEALEGVRAIAQLGPWITTGVAQQLRERRAARTELRTLTRDARRTVARPGRAHAVRDGGVIEAVVVLHAEARATAVALRLEVVGGRWRATDLVVL